MSPTHRKSASRKLHFRKSSNRNMRSPNNVTQQRRRHGLGQPRKQLTPTKEAENILSTSRLAHRDPELESLRKSILEVIFSNQLYNQEETVQLRIQKLIADSSLGKQAAEEFLKELDLGKHLPLL